MAGEDYVAKSKTFTFAPGETLKRPHIKIIDDAHDEGSETMTVVLSNAVGARIKDGTATGTIHNSDAMPAAWLARFGRTVAEQVVDAVEDRLRAPPRAGMEAVLAGQRIGLSDGAAGEAAAERAGEEEAQAGLADLSDWLKGEDEADGARGLSSRTVTARDLLTGSSFALTAENENGGTASLWGRGAVSRFAGREGDLILDGEVTSAMLGADWAQGPWTAGLMVSHARGDGGYRGANSGEVESDLTGLYPYGRYAVSERVTLWGVAGYGSGSLTLTPEGRDGIETDIDLMMAAAGLRGVLVKAPAEGGPELAAVTDALGVRTTSAAVHGKEAGTGNLEAATGEVTRLRLGLEGTYLLRFDSGATLTPRLEVGVRHDGGDAETGFGLDLGGGLRWSDPESGVTAEVSGRGLLTHEAGGLRDRGRCGLARLGPAPRQRPGVEPHAAPDSGRLGDGRHGRAAEPGHAGGAGGQRRRRRAATPAAGAEARLRRLRPGGPVHGDARARAGAHGHEPRLEPRLAARLRAKRPHVAGAEARGHPARG